MKCTFKTVGCAVIAVGLVAGLVAASRQAKADIGEMRLAYDATHSPEAERAEWEPLLLDDSVWRVVLTETGWMWECSVDGGPVLARPPFAFATRDEAEAKMAQFRRTRLAGFQSSESAR